jgi:hypothetical protein
MQFLPVLFILGTGVVFILFLPYWLEYIFRDLVMPFVLPILFAVT